MKTKILKKTNKKAKKSKESNNQTKMINKEIIIKKGLKDLQIEEYEVEEGFAEEIFVVEEHN